MKTTTTNLFAKWIRGQLAGPKVYLIRVYYIDKSGNSQTCLKLGFTTRPLHERVIEFLREMGNATGLTITHYGLVSILNNERASRIEHALHKNNFHIYFYRETGHVICFDGSTEILPDTPENCQIFDNPDSFYREGEHVISYNPRKTKRSAFNLVSNVA
jgi:hypothetical protein